MRTRRISASKCRGVLLHDPGLFLDARDSGPQRPQVIQRALDTADAVTNLISFGWDPPDVASNFASRRAT